MSEDDHLKQEMLRKVQSLEDYTDEFSSSDKANLPLLDVQKYTSISRRLWRRFGGGDQPEKRRTFFNVVQNVTTEVGPQAYEMLNRLVHQSRIAERDQGRWFCSAWRKRAEKLGWLDPPGDF